MLTFMEFGNSSDQEEEKILELIRKGMNLQRSDDFWDDLLSMCGNADAMSKLLDVPKEKITGLAGKINKIKSKIDTSDDSSRKDRLLKTGEN